MTHALITFLGRTPRDSNGYRTTNYRFPDGHESGPTAVLGWHLAQWLCPHRMIVLGTEGSMWDFLAESAGIGDRDDMVDIWSDLMDAGAKGSVSPEHLQSVEPLIEDHLGIETRLRLIPRGLDEAEQIGVLHAMADATEDARELTLDVSHAFRHLPMIAIVAGVYLQAVRNVRLRNLWYGFYDPDTEAGTAHDLKGLLLLVDWVRALSQFEHTGDYGVFAELLASGRADLASLMHEAAFFERTTRETLAMEKINTILKEIRTRPLDGVAGLFQSTLEDRLKWAGTHAPQRRQRDLARNYLERRDYLRAALYALEAFVTHLVRQDGGRPLSFGDRKKAKEKYEAGTMSDSYKNLRDVRNAMAHGLPPDREIKRLMRREDALRAKIERFLDEFPED